MDTVDNSCSFLDDVENKSEMCLLFYNIFKSARGKVYARLVELYDKYGNTFKEKNYDSVCEDTLCNATSELEMSFCKDMVDKINSLGYEIKKVEEK